MPGSLSAGSSQVPIVAMEGLPFLRRLFDAAGHVSRTRDEGTGIEILIVTNAAWHESTATMPNPEVIIEDQINLMGDNPLRGINGDNLGALPDVLILRSKQSRWRTSRHWNSASTCFTRASSSRSPAESRNTGWYQMLRGMEQRCSASRQSPEVIVTETLSLQVLGLVITDICLPRHATEPVDIAKILKIAAEGGENSQG